jgi:hypothetical protein
MRIGIGSVRGAYCADYAADACAPALSGRRMKIVRTSLSAASFSTGSIKVGKTGIAGTSNAPPG